MDRVTPKKFEENLEKNIEIIIRKVNNNSYHFTRYKQLLFTKGEGVKFLVSKKKSDSGKKSNM